MKKYKKAQSQGAYIDRLRVKYPFRIYRTGEPENVGVLCGVQLLFGGQDAPRYRFAGGVSVEFPDRAGIEIVEW